MRKENVWLNTNAWIHTYHKLYKVIFFKIKSSWKEIQGVSKLETHVQKWEEYIHNWNTHDCIRPNIFYTRKTLKSFIKYDTWHLEAARLNGPMV